MTRSQNSISKKCAHFDFMKKEPEKIGQIVPQHIEYWQELNLTGYMGGPFSDRSGGLIIFNCESKEKAELLVSGDPFVSEGLLTQTWLKEWIPE